MSTPDSQTTRRSRDSPTAGLLPDDGTPTDSSQASSRESSPSSPKRISESSYFATPLGRVGVPRQDGSTTRPSAGRGPVCGRPLGGRGGAVVRTRGVGGGDGLRGRGPRRTSRRLSAGGSSPRRRVKSSKVPDSGRGRVLPPQTTVDDW